MKLDIASMEISETKTLIKQGFRRRVKGLKSKPLMILGHKGIGKTQIVDQCAAELSKELGKEVKVRKVDLTYFEAPEIRGLSEVRENDKGVRKTYTAPPEDLFPTDDEYAIVLLDELNRVDDKGVKSSLLTLLEEYRVSTTLLSKNCFIVCIGNPQTETKHGDDMYENIQQLDAALTDRLKQFTMISNPAAVFAHLKPKYPDSKVLQAFLLHPELIGFDGTGISPRAIEAAAVDTLDWDLESAALELRASFGDKMADMILRIIRDEVESKALPGIEEFLDSKTAQEALIFMRDNAHRGDYTDMLVQQSLIKMDEWWKNKASLNKQMAQNFCTMVLALPKDKIISLYHQSVKNKEQAVQLFSISQKAGTLNEQNFYSVFAKVLNDLSSKKSQAEVA